MTSEDKREVSVKVVEALKRELDGFLKAARAAQAAATDPDSKAENKYDTRNLEASYLARGVAFRVAETEAALSAWESMPPQDFSEMRPVGVGALVVLENRDGSAGYFVGPGGGGITVEHEGMEVTVITPESPVGRQLMKQREGAIFYLESGGQRVETVIAEVC
ncbi:MAG: hypothetical protein JWL81_3281 [Verrucomicrobiales bacterium]|nr:hypothetical protein [Verrucomicrobiales bacterium]